jgi:hypothetical protein
MPSNLEKQINEERARLHALRSKLDTGRTPYMKWRLGLALHILEDGEAALRDVKGDTNDSDWTAFASFCLQLAMEKRKEVEETANKYGGPANVVEMGG